MDGCSIVVSKRVIRSASRNRVRIPKSILSRVPRGEALAGVDEGLDLADGASEGIKRRRLSEAFRKRRVSGGWQNSFVQQFLAWEPNVCGEGSQAIFLGACRRHIPSPQES
jgi:hypothetical protein